MEQIKIKNGETVVIREVSISDAEQYTRLENTIHDETKYLAHSTEEKKILIEDIKEKLLSSINSKTTRIIVAEVGGRLIGRAKVKQVSKYQRIAHRCELSIAVVKNYWGYGVGRTLMEEIINAAKQLGFEQIELIVVKDNERAHNMYLSFGFEDEGILKRGFKYPDGTYVDEFMMVKFL